MGLNDTFDHIRNQVLLMDPLPSVNKAYSMVLRVEKQREVHIIFPEANDNAAMMIKTSEYRRGNGGRNVYNRGSGRTGYGRGQFNAGRGNNRRYAGERDYSHCDHCNMNGHTRDGCFKLKGYPEWWHKNLKEQRSRVMDDGRYLANMADTPLDFEEGNHFNEDRKLDLGTSSNIADIVKQEMQKVLKGKVLINMDDKVNFSHIKEYAGMSSYHFLLTVLDNLKPGTWIVDTGASNHICTDLNLMTKLRNTTQPIHVYLPDGTNKPVRQIGDVKLNPKLCLKESLYVPTFKFNLLSVPKLTQNAQLKLTFYPNFCLMQDLQNE